MDIATCSYTEFEPAMGLPVRTSLGLPRFKLRYELPSRQKLWAATPRGNYLRAPKPDYERAYFAQLHSYGIDRIWADLEGLHELTGADRAVLLCFERLGENKPDNWCHRRLFAQWFFEQTGDAVPELGSVPAVPAAEEPTIF